MKYFKMIFLILALTLVFTYTNKSYALNTFETDLRKGTNVNYRYTLIPSLSHNKCQEVMVEDSSLHRTVLIERHYENIKKPNEKAYIFELTTIPFQRGRHILSEARLDHGDDFINDRIKVKLNLKGDYKDVNVGVSSNLSSHINWSVSKKKDNRYLVDFKLNEMGLFNDDTRDKNISKGFIIYNSNKRVKASYEVKYLSVLGYEVKHEKVYF